MTMHIDNRLSTLRTKKRQARHITKAQKTQYSVDLLEYNRNLRQQGRRAECMTMDEYTAYRLGELPKREPEQLEPMKEYVPKPIPGYDDQPVYESASMSGKPALKKEAPKYTGDLVKGIAQTHKSNAVPVISQQEILDIRHMRR